MGRIRGSPLTCNQHNEGLLCEDNIRHSMDKILCNTELIYWGTILHPRKILSQSAELNPGSLITDHIMDFLWMLKLNPPATYTTQLINCLYRMTMYACLFCFKISRSHIIGGPVNNFKLITFTSSKPAASIRFSDMRAHTLWIQVMVLPEHMSLLRLPNYWHHLQTSINLVHLRKSLWWRRLAAW